MRILFVFGDASYVLTHRKTLLQYLMKEGWEVEIACPKSSILKDLADLGFILHSLNNFDRGGLNPLQDLKGALELYKLFKERSPRIVHGVAMKAMLLTLMALFMIPAQKRPKGVITLGGLGYLFLSSRPKIKSIRALLVPFIKFLFNRTGTRLVIQNRDDEDTLKAAGMNLNRPMALIPGSGVCPHTFPYTPEVPLGSEGPGIVYVGRFLKDKGLLELVQAVRLLKHKGYDFTCRFYGYPDPYNPASISQDQIRFWEQEGLVHWMGHTSHPYEAYAESHIVVLPSYREGLPKALLEASLTGRPVVATDVPGCRDVVCHDETGFLVPLKDVQGLANALETLIDQKELRETMGKKAHDYVLNRFADPIIHSMHETLYGTL
jgi:glycosyltransferase involved in cell wall biosynthesis